MGVMSSPYCFQPGGLSRICGDVGSAWCCRLAANGGGKAASSDFIQLVSQHICL